MKKLFFTLALVLFPVQVWAAGCGCGSINAMISAAKSETIQAVNAYTAAEAQAIRSEILLAAQNIIGTIKSETATVVRALVALKESNVAAIKGQAVAGEAMKTEDLYGTAAQPSGLCGATSLGAGIQLGAQAGQEIHATMRENSSPMPTHPAQSRWNFCTVFWPTTSLPNPKVWMRSFRSKARLRKTRWRRRMNPSKLWPIPIRFPWSRTHRKKLRRGRPTQRQGRFMKNVWPPLPKRLTTTSCYTLPHCRKT